MTPADRIHVLCARNYSPALLDRLRAVSTRLVIEQRPANSRAELAKIATPEIEVLFSSHAPESLASLPGLRWLQTRAAGVNAFMGTPLWQSDVMLTTASG